MSTFSLSLFKFLSFLKSPDDSVVDITKEPGGPSTQPPCGGPWKPDPTIGSRLMVCYPPEDKGLLALGCFTRSFVSFLSINICVENQELYG